MNILAIDIGGTKISAALISRDNQLTHHTQIKPLQVHHQLNSMKLWWR